MKKVSNGFTLIELLVVISIIGILSAVLYVNFSHSTAQSRDAQRKSDLRELQTAIELYKNDNGRYPEGCNGPNAWSGQNGGGSNCSSGSQYIVDLAPKYIATLPTDPKLNSTVTDSGYMYTVNAEGTVYKLMAKNTVETDTIDYQHPFKSCDYQPNIPRGMCWEIITGSAPGNTPAWCKVGNSQFDHSYALWGGYGGSTRSPENNFYDRDVEWNTEKIICDIK